VKRVGILGGTFDPIHYGHLLAAEEARFAFELSSVVFVPASLPPHKINRVITSAEDRLAIVSLATASNAYFSVSTVELERPGPSYTVDTMLHFRKEWGKAAAIFYIMGVDSLSEIATWHEPHRLLELCELIVVDRPGYTPPGQDSLAKIFGDKLDRIHYLTIPHLAISAADLRKRIREGRSIKYQVPEEVERYISEHWLYKDNTV